jgi:hypothetical protein
MEIVKSFSILLCYILIHSEMHAAHRNKSREFPSTIIQALNGSGAKHDQFIVCSGCMGLPRKYYGPCGEMACNGYERNTI